MSSMRAFLASSTLGAILWLTGGHALRANRTRMSRLTWLIQTGMPQYRRGLSHILRWLLWWMERRGFWPAMSRSQA